MSRFVLKIRPHMCLLQKHHIFFNNTGFHNHIAHHLLTLYGLGAPASVIERQYKLNASYQRPVVLSTNQVSSGSSKCTTFETQPYHITHVLYYLNPRHSIALFLNYLGPGRHVHTRQFPQPSW